MDKGFYPDKEFFWGICFTIIPKWANEYYDQVINERRNHKQKPPVEKKIVMVSAQW